MNFVQSSKLNKYEKKLKNFREKKCNLYRLPMNGLNQSAEIVVQDMLYGMEYYRFTEETFYYEPCVVKYIDESTNSRVQTSVNLCDWKLFALELTTGESKMIVENSGMTILSSMHGMTE